MELNVVTVIVVVVTVGELMLVRADVLRLVGSALDGWLEEVKSAVAVAAVIVMLVMVLCLCDVGSLAVDIVVILQLSILLRLKPRSKDLMSPGTCSAMGCLPQFLLVSRSLPSKL